MRIQSAISGRPVTTATRAAGRRQGCPRRAHGRRGRATPGRRGRRSRSPRRAPSGARWAGARGGATTCARGRARRSPGAVERLALVRRVEHGMPQPAIAPPGGGQGQGSPDAAAAAVGRDAHVVDPGDPRHGWTTTCPPAGRPRGPRGAAPGPASGRPRKAGPGAGRPGAGTTVGAARGAPGARARSSAIQCGAQPHSKPRATSRVPSVRSSCSAMQPSIRSPSASTATTARVSRRPGPGRRKADGPARARGGELEPAAEPLTAPRPRAPCDETAGAVVGGAARQDRFVPPPPRQPARRSRSTRIGWRKRKPSAVRSPEASKRSRSSASSPSNASARLGVGEDDAVQLAKSGARRRWRR